MKKLALFIVFGLAGCNVASTIATVDNALLNLSGNSIPKACQIISVAEGYFHNLEGNISADKIKIERDAEAAVGVICNNPPKDTAAAFGTLVQLWFTIQNMTKTN